MFCDASGSPPILAATIFDGLKILYTVLEVPTWFTDRLCPRDDEYIMGLELAAITLGLETLRPTCIDASITVWTDNAGGEGALRRGSSSAPDYNAIVHITWKKALQLRAGKLFIFPLLHFRAHLYEVYSSDECHLNLT